MKEVFFHFFKTGIFKGIFGTGLKVKMTFMHKLKAMQSSGINGLRQFWASILVSFFGLQGLMAEIRVGLESAFTPKSFPSPVATETFEGAEFKVGRI